MDANTFLLVAADCPATRGVVPTSRGGRETVASIQYALLTENPYRFTHEELLFAVHVRHKGIKDDELAARGEAIRAEFFSKPHPCLRASPLPKSYGWGVHYDALGRIALIAVDSEEYRPLARGERGTKVAPSMRNRRATA